MKGNTYRITDDTGALAIVDPDAYSSFVGEEWEVEQLDEHFKAQMGRKHLLVWETGHEAMWQIRVHFAETGVRGYREVTGPIIATQGRLLLTSYNSLTMAAQYDDVKLPEPHERDQVLTVPPGEYHCRIIQMYDFDPFADNVDVETEVDFVIEVVEGDGSLPPWSEPPWASYVLKQWVDPDTANELAT